MSTPVTPGSARWNELVKEGIIRDGNRNWYLGDAALEISPIGPDAKRNGTLALVKRFANEIGVNPKTLGNMRKVAHAWAPAHRWAGASWKVHEVLMSKKSQHLIRKGMTVTQAMTALGQSTTSRTGPESSLADRIEQVEAAIAADPQVAAAALAVLDRGEPAEDQTSDLWEVVEAMRSASINVRRANELLRKYGRLTGDMGDALRELVSITRSGCDWMDSLLTEGGFTDENLARLVGDGFK